MTAFICRKGGVLSLLTPSPFSTSFSSVHRLCTHLDEDLPSPSPQQRHDDDSRNVKVSVWWDFENCRIPSGVSAFKVAHCIMAAVRANGIKGPVQITAFGNVALLPNAKQEALSSTGISLSHIPVGGKNSTDRFLLMDLMNWVIQNPPPAHIFLISGDKDFSPILHRLRMNNYNILLATPESAPHVLCSASTVMWLWDSILREENLSGKHFNHPPDGLGDSWYGEYEGHLEVLDPDNDNLTVSSPVPSPVPASDLIKYKLTKTCPIPKKVVNQIRRILCSSPPDGIQVSELRNLLGKCGVDVDKDYYGHKKFSSLLLSMPYVVNIHKKDGIMLAHSHGYSTMASESSANVYTIQNTVSITEDTPELSFLFSTSQHTDPAFLEADGFSNDPNAGRTSKASSNENLASQLSTKSSHDGSHAREHNYLDDSGYFQKKYRNWGLDEGDRHDEIKKKAEKFQLFEDFGNNCGEFAYECRNEYKSAGNSQSSETKSDDNFDETPSFISHVVTWCKFWGSHWGFKASSGHFDDNMEHRGSNPTIRSMGKTFWSR